MEDGLEQEFNSLDAQRDSAESYIKSQKINGWKLLPDYYDDGGYSGGTTERPALKRLLADVQAGKVDIIVVYKMDRLSRSLLDFMNMAEFLEQRNVSFVSVTQDINTSTSTGRMMLNILMTFSEYERAVITERIKDKIAGAKKRGKYCGGAPVLGYDVKPKVKKLKINPEEARIVVSAYKLYLKHGSSKVVAKLLNEKGFTTKSWTSNKGKFHPGRPFNPAIVHRMLTNVLYLGKVNHHGTSYEGEHEAIIETKLWESVQQVVKANANVPAGFKKNVVNSPFKGLLKCGYCGGSFVITYSTKGKSSKGTRRYMYYLCFTDEKRTESQCPIRRIPAGEIDRVILGQLSKIFKTPSMLAKSCEVMQEADNDRKSALLDREKTLLVEQQKLRQQIHKGGDFDLLHEKFKKVENELAEIKIKLQDARFEFTNKDVIEACDSIEAVWQELFPAERYRLANLLISKITVFADRMLIDIKTNGLKSLVNELKKDDSTSVFVPDDSTNGDLIRLETPMVIRRMHGRKIIILPDQEASMLLPAKDPMILARTLARAHAWTELLESGEVNSISELADKLSLNVSYVGKILRLVGLSPTIQQQVVAGKAPANLTINKLKSTIPTSWEEQEQALLC